jgi:hypothetical protein
MNAGELISELGKLNLKGYRIKTRIVKRSGISATKVDVIIENSSRNIHRNLSDIYNIIDSSSLSNFVKKTAMEIFNLIAEAEARIHNTTTDKVRFHEIGAIDSIVDIVGTAICIEKMGIEKIFTSRISLGSGGFIDAEHGRMPIPSPAVLELLKGFPVILTDIPFELTTPTGAGIISALASYGLERETIKIQSTGYGAGDRDIPQQPNILRIIIGELPTNYETDRIFLVETNIDDMNPEIFPFVIERLMDAGALDAFMTPVIMKKGRPGMIISAIVHKDKLDPIMSIIFSETSTLGLRVQEVERRKLPRSEKRIETPFGNVRFKSVIIDGSEKLIPEFEECRKIAISKNIPLIEVYRILESYVANK